MDRPTNSASDLIELLHTWERIQEERWALWEKVQETQWSGHRKEHQMLDRALDVATQTMQERLETMNKFREQITNERGEYVRREFYEERHNELQGRVEKNEQITNNWQGRFWMLGFLVTIGATVLSSLVSVILWLWKK